MKLGNRLRIICNRTIFKLIFNICYLNFTEYKERRIKRKINLYSLQEKYIQQLIMLATKIKGFRYRLKLNKRLRLKYLDILMLAFVQC